MPRAVRLNRLDPLMALALAPSRWLALPLPPLLKRSADSCAFRAAAKAVAVAGELGPGGRNRSPELPPWE